MSQDHLTDYIGFVYGDRDCELLTKVYPDCARVRVPLQNAQSLINRLPSTAKIWIDPEVDSFERWFEKSFKYKRYLETFADAPTLADPAFQDKPDRAIVRRFVSSVLDRCLSLRPSAISVPQLPMSTDSSRAKINRELASACGYWAEQSKFRGVLILPVILTHPDQYLKKTARNPKVKNIESSFFTAGAKGLWLVDSSLYDQDGARTLEPRFRSMIDLHTELNQAIPDVSVVAGPHWAFNILLWAKGLVKYPAISMGNRFKYYIGGGLAQTPNNRVALDSVKRSAVVSQDLRNWLLKATEAIPATDPAHLEFASLTSDFSKLLRTENREQICRVQRKWLDSLSALPLPGRSLALYQQLSSAYVLGKSLPDLPIEGSSRRPERLAQQLMLFCL